MEKFTVHMATSNTGYRKNSHLSGTSSWNTEADFVRYCNMMDDMTRKYCHHTKAIEGEDGLTSIVCIAYEGVGNFRREVGRTRYTFAKRKQDLTRHLRIYDAMV